MILQKCILLFKYGDILYWDALFTKVSVTQCSKKVMMYLGCNILAEAKFCVLLFQQQHSN
jgi:hypothetical protein